MADQLFATLDPTTRRWELPRSCCTDFDTLDSKLPTHLVAAFRATLEEIAEADLLLHIVDASHPDAVQQWRSVMNTLKDLKADDPMITALNKIDRIDLHTDLIQRVIPEFSDSILISALKSKLG